MIHLTITIQNTSDLLDSHAYGPGALGRWESAPANSGPYTEQGTFALMTGVSSYSIWDPAGLPTFWYRTRVSTAGWPGDSTTPSSYSEPFPGAASTKNPYCTVEQVKQRETGDTPVASGAFDATIGDAITEIGDLIDREVRNLRGQGEGWSFLPGAPVTRRYTGNGSNLLLIDDAVQVTSVALLDANGNLIQTLTVNVDYLPYPLNGLPIIGLQLTHGIWPSYPGGVQVTLTPGYCNSLPPNITDACIEEVIRTIRAGQAGVDDRVGTTPFGSVVVSKALTQKTYRMLSQYRLGAGLLRGN